ncbi:GPI-anchored cell wall beta-1,3-endoglucanase EglC [Microdochium bolleyi]|uniref:glucan endo-1,3-beta-D-glucosidase n=1 Tax=Microdochium bolleyi TaxID=196109 RepID=A0A136JFP4_9PEZI|nr:GPI-anchored cell wall beta-1,3-endoglucanase EglC [Microdochium bolleyi]
MKFSLITAAFGLAATGVEAVDWNYVQKSGFNYGATDNNGRCRTYDDFRNLMTRARNLPNAPGPFRQATARLYTSIQCGTANTPISAFQAAMDTGTPILVGLWASGGRGNYENELNALLAAERQWGNRFTDLIMGISVGSEDLYRSSPQGVANNAGVGATGAEIEGYIGWLRDWIRNTRLQNKPIGHVDTFTAWELPENQGVARSVDWLGHNGFPYWESNKPNSIDNARANWDAGIAVTNRIANGKRVWVTETGWPHKGPNSGAAVASIENARKYWLDVGCHQFGFRNVFWYTLVDANVDQASISFGITPRDSANPFYSLQCPA